MAQIVELSLASGGSVFFEVDEVPGGKRYRAAGTAVAEATVQTLESAIARLKPFAEVLTSSLSSVSTATSDISVEFGVKLSADAGFVIAKAGSEASLVIKLSWKRAD